VFDVPIAVRHSPSLLFITYSWLEFELIMQMQSENEFDEEFVLWYRTVTLRLVLSPHLFNHWLKMLKIVSYVVVHCNCTMCMYCLQCVCIVSLIS